MEWMDMNKAPKDGTAILVANTDGAWIAYYCDQYQSGYRPDNPWQSLMLNRRYMKKKYASEVPTGWMPLPEPPKETE